MSLYDRLLVLERLRTVCAQERCERCGRTGATQRHYREGACIRITLLCDACDTWQKARNQASYLRAMRKEA
jgi:hypothetical protein